MQIRYKVYFETVYGMHSHLIHNLHCFRLASFPSRLAQWYYPKIPILGDVPDVVNRMSLL